MLVLAETEMIPWKPDVCRVMGDILGMGLELRRGGSEAQESFCFQVCVVCSGPTELLCCHPAHQAAADCCAIQIHSDSGMMPRGCSDGSYKPPSCRSGWHFWSAGLLQAYRNESAEVVLLVQVLHPAMNVLLQSDEWTRWDETLQRMWYPSTNMVSFVQRAAAYKETLASRRPQMSASGTSAEIAVS